MLIITAILSGTCAANNLSDCDKVTGPHVVRYDYGYVFFNTFENSSTEPPVYLNRWKVDYVNPEFLDSPPPQGKNVFNFTKQIRDKEYKIAPGESIRHLESVGAFRIAKKPNKNINFDFAIKYTTYFDFSNTPQISILDRTHISCGTYKISYCGDGVLDEKYGEKCDDGNDMDGDGCSATCNPELEAHAR